MSSAPFYTLEETARDVDRILELEFAVVPGFRKLTTERIQTVSNGSGPGQWSNKRRHFLTDIEPEGARLAAIAHDVGYCSPDKSRKNFDSINQAFYDNQVKWAHAVHAEDPAARAYCLAWAEVEYQAVHLGGWEAWLAGDVLEELDTEDAGPEVLA